MKYCIKCGSELRGVKSYCVACGAQQIKTKKDVDKYPKREKPKKKGQYPFSTRNILIDLFGGLYGI